MTVIVLSIFFKNVLGQFIFFDNIPAPYPTQSLESETECQGSVIYFTLYTRDIEPQFHLNSPTY